MNKRWAIALLLSSSSQASWYIEPRLYSGEELNSGVMAHYSLPWVEVGGGLLSNFNASKNKYELDAEVQLSKAFQLNEHWAFAIGFGSLLGEHWLSDYQFRYRVNDFTWLTTGYRYHLDEDYHSQNQFYLGYRLGIDGAADALALSPAYNEFVMDSEFYAQGLFGVGSDTEQWGAGFGVNFPSSATLLVESKLWSFIGCRVDVTIREREDGLMIATRTLLVMVAYMVAANVLMLIAFGA